VIVVDANYFLGAMVRPVTTQDRTMAETTKTLFLRVLDGDDVFTTTDAVIAEVVFALQRHYGLSRPDVATRLKPVLQLRGCKLPTKRLCVRALDPWEVSSKISFVDALAAVQARDENRSLAAFDHNLTRVTGVTIWEPPPPMPSET
jgi:predicted nucleic acid-binding protein